MKTLLYSHRKQLVSRLFILIEFIGGVVGFIAYLSAVLIRRLIVHCHLFRPCSGYDLILLLFYMLGSSALLSTCELNGKNKAQVGHY